MTDRIADARDIWQVQSAAQMYAERITNLAQIGKSVLLDGTGRPARKGVIPIYVSDGRWVATCPSCNGGTTYFPGERRTICPDCGSGWDIKLPPRQALLEARLLQRPPRNQQCPREWLDVIGKDLLDLLEEDIAKHGLAHESWTAPRTWVTAEFVTAALMNTHLRDNLLQTAPALATTAGKLIRVSGANTIIESSDINVEAGAILESTQRASPAGDGAWNDVSGMSITLTTTETCHILAWITCNIVRTGADGEGSWRLSIDGTTLNTYAINNNYIVLTQNGNPIQRTLMGIKLSVAAGSIVVKIQHYGANAAHTARFDEKEFMALAVPA